VGLRQIAFSAARSRPAGALVRLAFGRFSKLLPLEQLVASGRVALYRHPKPAYGSTHLLAVPLRGVKDLVSLTSLKHAALRKELWTETAAWRDRYEAPWMLVNAGPRQDVFQIHFHLTTECPPELALHPDTFGTWEQAIVGVQQLPNFSDLMRKGFGLVSGPDGRVHVATER
jgi:hypothetical protein